MGGGDKGILNNITIMIGRASFSHHTFLLTTAQHQSSVGDTEPKNAHIIEHENDC